MTYTPTKPELEELGFTITTFRVDDFIASFTYVWEFVSLDISYDSRVKSFSIWIYDMDRMRLFYPRSLDHLKQIILAFNSQE